MTYTVVLETILKLKNCMIAQVNLSCFHQSAEMFGLYAFFPIPSLHSFFQDSVYILMFLCCILWYDTDLFLLFHLISWKIIFKSMLIWSLFWDHSHLVHSLEKHDTLVLKEAEYHKIRFVKYETCIVIVLSI